MQSLLAQGGPDRSSSLSLCIWPWFRRSPYVVIRKQYTPISGEPVDDGLLHEKNVQNFQKKVLTRGLISVRLTAHTVKHILQRKKK
jgi:hypothetical protein